MIPFLLTKESRFFIYKHNRKNLNNLRIKTFTNSPKRIRNLIDNKNNNTHIKSKVEIYTILCVDCKKNIQVKLLVILKKQQQQQIYEHIRDLKKKEKKQKLRFSPT